MLSFDSTNDKDIPIALGYPNSECIGKPIFTVYFQADYHSKPAIGSSDPKNLIVNERYRLQTEFGLSRREFETIVDIVAKHEPVPEHASRAIKRAYLAIQKVMHDKLKRELEFGPHDNVWVKPIYDTRPNRQNQIMTLFASSGAGKSFMVNDYCMRNPAVQDDIVPGIFLFSSVGDDDPSYKPIKDRYQFKFFWKDPRDLDPEDTDIHTYQEKSILIFDDINSIGDKKVRNRLIQFREMCLEIARHRSLVIISTEHLYHARAKTQKLRNSSAYLTLYPRNSPKPIDDVLENIFNLNRHAREALITKVKREARSQFLHIDYPGYLINEKRVMLF